MLGSLEEFQKILDKHALAAKKPYGMHVSYNITNSGYELTAHWDLQQKAELIEHCKRFYSNPPIVKMTLSPRRNRKDQKSICLPPNGAEVVLQAMEKNTYLTEVVIPNSFFNKDQKNRLNNLLKKNIQTAKQKAQEIANQKQDKILKSNQQQSIVWSLLGAVSGVAFSIVAGFTLAAMMPVTLCGAGTGLILSLGRQAYLRKASSYYNDPQTINPSDDKSVSGTSVSDSFKAGIQSQYWPGYFTSYFKLATYCHPIAFAAAMNHAVQDNEEIVKKMKMRR